MVEKPRINTGQLVQSGHREARSESGSQGPEPVRTRPLQPLLQQRLQIVVAGRRHQCRLLETVAVGLQRAHGLLQRLLEGAADGHGLPHRLHLSGQHVRGLGKFLEGEPRHLHHHVVDGGLEAGRGLPGHVVGNLVQRVTHRQLGGDLGDGKSGGLAGQGRAAGHPRVHLDDHQAAVVRMHRELDVGAPGIHADLPDDAQRGVTHHLVFLVRQGLGRRHGDGVPGVDPHGVEVLDGAHDDHVVLVVAHHLQLELLPAQYRLLHQDLVHRG